MVDLVYQKMEELRNQSLETNLEITPSLYGAKTGERQEGKIERLTEVNFHVTDFIRAYAAGMAEELYQLYLDFPECLRKGKTEIVISGN